MERTAIHFKYWFDCRKTTCSELRCPQNRFSTFFKLETNLHSQQPSLPQFNYRVRMSAFYCKNLSSVIFDYLIKYLFSTNWSDNQRTVAKRISVKRSGWRSASSYPASSGQQQRTNPSNAAAAATTRRSATRSHKHRHSGVPTGRHSWWWCHAYARECPFLSVRWGTLYYTISCFILKSSRFNWRLHSCKTFKRRCRESSQENLLSFKLQAIRIRLMWAAQNIAVQIFVLSLRHELECCVILQSQPLFHIPLSSEADQLLSGEDQSPQTLTIKGERWELASIFVAACFEEKNLSLDMTLLFIEWL